MNEEEISKLIPKPWTFPYPDREMYSREQLLHFGNLIWNEAYRQGIHDGWSDAMTIPYLDEPDCPCGGDGGTSCGDPNCLMITGDKE